MIAFPRDRKSLDGNAVDRILSRRPVVAPREIVARARREHTYLGVSGQPFRDVAGMQLAAAVDLGAVPLHDDRRASWLVSRRGDPACCGGSGSSRDRFGRGVVAASALAAALRQPRRPAASAQRGQARASIGEAAARPKRRCLPRLPDDPVRRSSSSSSSASAGSIPSGP